MKEEKLVVTVGEETEQLPTGELLVVSPRVSVASSKMGGFAPAMSRHLPPEGPSVATNQRPNSSSQEPAVREPDVNLPLQERIQPREIVDAEGFVRTEFSVPNNETVTVIFRGREELPGLERPEDTVTTIVSPDQRPLHAPEADFDKWKAELTDGSLLEGADKVRLIATATPQGIVETAIKLGESGAVSVSSEQLNQIKDLQERLETSEVDSEIINLFDQMFAATAIRDGQDGIEPNEQGLMEVVLSLLGDEGAIAAVLEKQQKIATLDKARDEKEEQERGLAVDLKQSGEPLSEAELEILRNNRLVGVHTTAVQPGYLSEGNTGVRVVRPAESTVHWSLNHPTRSLSGGLGARPITIVSPMEDIAALNGAPAALSGFDTFYTEGPGEVMQIPETALIIEMVSDPEAQAIELAGNTLRIKATDLHTAELSQILDVIAQTYLPDNSERALSVLSEDFLKYDGNVFNSLLLGIAQNRRNGHRDNELDDPETRAHFEQMDELESLLQQLNPNQTHFSELEQDEQQRIFEQLIRGLFTEPRMIENYPNVQKVLLEALRQEVVRLQISKLGGKNVEAFATSSGVNDAEFNSVVEETARVLGLGQDLISYRPERELEKGYRQATQYATEYVDGPEGSVAGGFNWATYIEETRPIWDSMLEASVATRRQAVSKGLLPQVRQKPVPPRTPSGSVWG